MAAPTEVRLCVIERETGQQLDYVGTAIGRVVVPYPTGLKTGTPRRGGPHRGLGAKPPFQKSAPGDDA